MSPTILRAQLARLRRDEGQTMVEYALLAFLVAVTAILFLSAIGLDMAEWMDGVENALGLGADNSPDATPGTDDANTAAGVNPLGVPPCRPRLQTDDRWRGCRKKSAHTPVSQAGRGLARALLRSARHMATPPFL